MKAWFLADSPTSVSPLAVMATTLGVERDPRALGIIAGLSPSSQAQSEFVVPKSIPMTVGMSEKASAARGAPLLHFD
jgi:hypothetical protein